MLENRNTFVRLEASALQNLEGLMRTFVESLCADAVQRKAASDIVAQLVWSRFGKEWHAAFTEEQWKNVEGAATNTMPISEPRPRKRRS